jgi:CBS domain-containing protein
MTTEVLTTHEDETVDRTMQKMTNRRCRHLPVVEGGELAGIVSIGDLVKHRLEELEDEHRAMREYIASA